jgi:site-specific DNA-methyltransferase (adenine-specific)
MKYQILHGDNRETLKTLPDNSIDAIVTDPPYGIDFLGKAWDANTGALETYQECLRVLKPGGHILAFSAARTYHHLAVTLEQAGFEIRDQIMWIYSSGFPKSQDVGRSIQRSLGVKQKKTLTPWENSKSRLSFDNAGEKLADTPASTQVICTDPEAQQWEGWGTALKPAHEPIALARKPIKLSIARNCQTHGVGALNIDATRIPATDLKEGTMGKAPPNLMTIGTPSTIETSDQPWIPSDLGRFPSNVIGDIPDYQKYFYCPKVSRAERHIGHETPPPMFGDVQGAYGPDGNRMAVGFDNRDKPVGYIGSTHPDDIKKHPLWDPSIGGNAARLKEKIIANTPAANVGNNHPTVKPIELMKYLIKLITPPGGTVLDPFNGSGSTGCAAVELGYEYIGCELDAKYVEIAKTRIEAWYEHVNPTTYNQLFEQDTK